MNDTKLLIRKIYSDLTYSQKRVADFVLENYNDLLDMSAQDIGDYSNTSSASVIRFFKKIGFEGLDHFKDQMFDHKKSTLMINPIINENDDVTTIITKTQSLANNTINDFFYQLNKDDLDQSITLLKNAKTIYIFGTGSSATHAYDLNHKLNKIGKNSIFNFDNHMTLEFLGHASSNDIILLISYSGESIEVLAPLKVALDNNIKVISLVSSSINQLVDESYIALTIPANDNFPRVGSISSKISFSILIDLLYLGIISENLTKIELDMVKSSSYTKLFRKK